MSCKSLCNVLQCLGEETPLCDFAVQLCVSTICWTVLTLLKCFLINKDMANAELISYEDVH